MKTIRNRLTTATTMALLISGLAIRVLAYPASYGPFPPEHEPTAVTLDKFELVREVKSPADDNAGAVREYRLQASSQGPQPITLTLHGITNGWIINLRDAQNSNLMPVTFTNRMTSSQMEMFSCDLNGDHQPDFIVNIWSGGCGLAAVLSEVTFLLSAKEGYRATSFNQYSFGKEDLVRFQNHGPVYFISNDLIGNDDEKTRDGRDHNFWVYQLHRIAESRFVPANADQPGFPKWVWFTNRDNHDETTQLSQEQKTSLLMKHNPIQKP